jgi:uncharacterized protein DUF6998
LNIGEIVAAAAFDLVLDEVGQATHDGRTSDGRLVQVKATFQDKLTFGRTPQLYLGFRLFPDGSHEVIFNGPGQIIFDAFKHRKGIGVTLVSLPNDRLKKLSAGVAEQDRVPPRFS